MPKVLLFYVIILVAIGIGTLGSQSAFAQSDHITYEKQPGVAGNITSVGSDTLANLMTTWSLEFKQLYPQVKFQIQASGSSTAPPALTEGTANIGPMSRELKTSEINYFSRVNGYKPLAIPVAIDAIALFVDTNNPIVGLTQQQVDGIFSATRYCGAAQPISNWRALGVTDSKVHQSIKLFGRNSVSGTYGLFKQLALCDGDFKAVVNELPGSASVVQSVAYSNGAIGYAAFGHKTAAVRALPIANQNGLMIPVNVDTIASGDYPFTRYLYLVVNKTPGSSLPLLEQEFIRFVLSKKGQQVVQKEGYVGIPRMLIERQLKAIME